MDPRPTSAAARKPKTGRDNIARREFWGIKAPWVRQGLQLRCKSPHGL